MHHLAYLDRSIATFDGDAPANDYQRGHLDALKVARAELATLPIPMLLFCPACGVQHVDAADEGAGWSNPPHKSHLCHGCGTIWRPADVPTTGVSRIETVGCDDSWWRADQWRCIGCKIVTASLTEPTRCAACRGTWFAQCDPPPPIPNPPHRSGGGLRA